TKSPDWKIACNGRPLAPRTPRQAARSGIGYISGDRAAKGIIGGLPVVDNVMASRRVVEHRHVVSRHEAAEARAMLQALNAGERSVWGFPAAMSGGTQQKLLIARWLALSPRILVLEEPTRGVDLGTKREIYALIRQLAEAGTIVIWWSTEHAELASLCDLVISFEPHGNPTGVLRADQLTDESLARATGMAA
ncbi:MAG: ATP-binding cassette domain-containing protein, partial [Acetobacteraceae bacterium]